MFKLSSPGVTSPVDDFAMIVNGDLSLTGRYCFKDVSYSEPFTSIGIQLREAKERV